VLGIRNLELFPISWRSLE